VLPRRLTSVIIWISVTGRDDTSKVNTPPPSLELMPKQEPEPPIESTLSGVLAPDAGVKDRGGHRDDAAAAAGAPTGSSVRCTGCSPVAADT
jgi:hypothetical protein